MEDACRGSRYLRICGQLVCGRGFMRMMGIGKKRFGVLGRAARKGEQHCPYDCRYVPRGPKAPSEKYKKVYDFLMEQWTNVAEFIPDGLNSNKRPRFGTEKLDSPSMNRSSIKHLPPGSLSEYHEQCQAATRDPSISRKLFSTAPCLSIMSSEYFAVVFTVFLSTWKFGFDEVGTPGMATRVQRATAGALPLAPRQMLYLHQASAHYQEARPLRCCSQGAVC